MRYITANQFWRRLSSNDCQFREFSKKVTTAGANKVASNIEGTPVMNHFNIVGVALSVWIPHCSNIFRNWYNVDIMSHLLEFSAAPRNVSGNEGAC